MEKIRVFVAVELADTIKNEIGRLQDDFKKVKTDVKWVRPESIHLTLKFFGYIPADQVRIIEKEITGIAENLCYFTVSVTGVGSFPVSGNPRVVWVGINDPDNKILNLQKNIEECFKKLGFAAAEHPYMPHLTIGRVNGKDNLKGFHALIKEKRGVEFPGMTISDISIIKSDLRPEGPVYTILKKIKLNRR
jgi:RNA 2',3'-cyclic 3'-phosphodiesterase